MSLNITTIDQSIGISNGFPGGPFKAVCAIFLADRDAYSADPLAVRKILGSGFLIQGYDIDFVTAKHVVETTLGENELFVLAFIPDVINQGVLTMGVDTLSFSENTDLAFGKVVCDDSLTLPGFQIVRNVVPNNNYATFEHSGSSCTPDGKVKLNVRLRKGYIVAQDKYSNPGPVEGSDILEMSYPCLLGASGSPVFDHQNLDLVGMLVQNVDHELAPTQLIRNVDDEGNLIEEVRYSIPQGIAISATTLNQELDIHVRH